MDERQAERGNHKRAEQREPALCGKSFIAKKQESDSDYRQSSYRRAQGHRDSFRPGIALVPVSPGLNPVAHKEHVYKPYAEGGERLNP